MAELHAMELMEETPSPAALNAQVSNYVVLQLGD